MTALLEYFNIFNGIVQSADLANYHLKSQPDSYTYLLCLKLCWHNRCIPKCQTVQLESRHPVDSLARINSPSRQFSQIEVTRHIVQPHLNHPVDSSARFKSTIILFSQNQVTQQTVQLDSSQTLYCSARIKSPSRQFRLNQDTHQTTRLLSQIQVTRHTVQITQQTVQQDSSHPVDYNQVTKQTVQLDLSCLADSLTTFKSPSIRFKAPRKLFAQN